MFKKNEKSENLLTKNVQRSKKTLNTCKTVIGGVRKAYNLGAFSEPPRDTLPKYIQIFCRKLAASFDLKVVEVEPVPKTHGLWVCNHVSWLDIAVVGSVCKVFFLSKAELEKWPFLGALVRAGGTLFIKRGSGDANYVSNQIADFLRQGSSVVFFPEATTTSGHKLKKFHGKLFQAAIDTGLPIQPVVCCYVDKDGMIADDVAYFGDMSIAKSLQKVMDTKNITAYVLPLEAVFAEGRTQEELADLMQSRMQTALTKLQKQVLKEKPKDAMWD